MSNVPKARRILRELLTNEWIGERIKTEIRAALRVMTRRPHVRETPRIMNGGVTPVAIIFEPSGKTSIKGLDTKI